MVSAGNGTHNPDAGLLGKILFCSSETEPSESLRENIGTAGQHEEPVLDDNNNHKKETHKMNPYADDLLLFLYFPAIVGYQKLPLTALGILLMSFTSPDF